ncbi:type IV secretory system conjugative DNA transfer family protein, partial [Nisaea sp.]
MLDRSAVIIRSLLVLMLVSFGAAMAATQYVAHYFSYNTALGEPLFVLAGYKVYSPVMWFVWVWRYSESNRDPFDQGMMIMAVIMLGGLFLTVAALTLRKKDPTGKFGTAKWATKDQLDPLKGHSGMVIGYSGERHDIHANPPRFITHTGPEHVALIAPSRSGKGASTVIPTLFRWMDSVVVLDIKGENWSTTSGWRQKFSKCIRFDPANVDSARFNPMEEISGDEIVADADLIASILVDPDGVKTSLTHWDRTARQLLKITILHLRLTDEDATLTGLKSWLTRRDFSVYDHMEEMLETEHSDKHAGRVINEGAQMFKGKYFPELSSTFSTALSYLDPFDDKYLSENTAASDFTINEIMNGETPVTLHIVFTPSDMHRLRGFLRLFLSLLARKLTDVNVAPAVIPHKRRALFLLDEFPRLGNLALFHDAIGYFAGYGITCLLVVQSVNDFVSIYGPHNRFLENCAVQIFHATNDPGTGDYVSRRTGTATHRERELNRSGHILAPFLQNVFVTEQENARPLLTAGEVQEMPADDQLLFAPNIPPARIKKLQWWNVPFLAAHSVDPAPAVPVGHVRAANPWAAVVTSAAII